MSDQTILQSAPTPIAPSISPVVSNTSGGSPVEHSMAGTGPERTSTGKASSQSEQQNPSTQKSDKPRPHVCSTCSRSFARLEHLKRHERSHTKEKPFECPECNRCFARRDLLLRHQQKLHMGAAPSAKSRAVRRESTSSLGPNMSNKVRKNSMASNSSSGSAVAGMRPRANTISHIDGTTLGMLATANRAIPNSDFASSQGQSINGTRGVFDSIGFNSGEHGHMNTHNLPRLATTGLAVGTNSGLRTAPPSNGPMNFDGLFGSGSTINPAHLHLGDSLANSASPNGRHFAPFSANGAIMEEDDNLDWMRGFNAQMSFGGLNEQVLADSPPSISNGMIPDSSIDASNDPHHASGFSWPNDSLQSNNHMPYQFSMDQSVSVPDLSRASEMVSPKSMAALSGAPDHLTFTQQSPLANGIFQNGQNAYQPQMAFGSDGHSISSSATGSARQSSITSVSTDSITDVTRQALLISLTQPSCFGHNTRKYSQPPVSSPLSPRDATKSSGVTLPSTFDLQRYVNAYIQYFHPHFPFLHIPTICFDSPAFTTLRAMPSGSGYGQTNIVGGGGCLILAMAAIGALYEYEKPASRDLFESAKKLIQLYLEERRKAEMSTASSSPGSANDLAAQNTPLWLVQAMLLNVIYGHNCGDKTVGEIASTHCSALVSLARAAELNNAVPMNQIPESTYSNGSESASNGDVNMLDGSGANSWNDRTPTAEEQAQWRRWIVSEERKRTLFAIFHLSSILVSAYNHAPALMNSEIQLDLPCDEDMWNTESARAWISKGGLHAVEQRAIPFGAALSVLLNAANASPRAQTVLSMNRPFGSGIPLSDVPDSQLKPSTFGCLVLINALHNYIWETRQRHSGRQWTTQETESMHAHIEPALRAWQAAWASNPTHSLERPNPYGQGPLSADCIPLLDLAYVRLFVNLGTSKEAFWQRDFDAMAEELARGAEIVQHADSDLGNGVGQTSEPQNVDSAADLKIPRSPPQDFEDVAGLRTAEQERSSKRERHLRKAAFYAADSLSMSDKIGVTFADFTSRELPLQSALCTFDCAQVLAEWVSTVQERVGRYLGILGQTEIDYTQVPAVMLLEDEDCRLLEKIADILAKVEAKMTFDIAGMPGSAAMTAMQHLSSVSQRGYGSKVLALTAYMLQRAAVWPVTSVMSQGLEVQAVHMNNRAENSLSAR